MAAYCRVYGVIHFTSLAGWLPVHRDQLRAQRSVTSMGKLYLLPFVCSGESRKQSRLVQTCCVCYVMSQRPSSTTAVWHGDYTSRPALQPVVQPVGWTMQMSPAKWRFSGPARQLALSVQLFYTRSRPLSSALVHSHTINPFSTPWPEHFRNADNA